MNRKRAADRAREYWELESVAAVLAYYELPTLKDLVEVLGKFAGDFISQLDDAFKWLNDAGNKLMTCANNKREVNGRDVNICWFEYDLEEWTPSIFGWEPFGTLKWPNFSVEPRVNECIYLTGPSLVCVADVHIHTEL
jgi:hypothetical protein